MKTGRLTPKEKKFIRDHFHDLSSIEIAEKLDRSKYTIRGYLYRNNLHPTKEETIRFRSRGMRRPFTQEEDNFIRKYIADRSSKWICQKLHRSSQYILGRARELGFSEVLRKKELDSRIKKGNIPFNKGKKQTEYMSPEAIARTAETRFQKGQLPHNTAEKDGVIRIRHDHPDRDPYNPKKYKYIRLSKGEWQLYHQYLWEKKYGKYDTKTHCLWFKDGNTLHCKLSNLELITRAENVRRNRSEFLRLPGGLQEVKLLSNKLNKIIHDQSRTDSAVAP